MIIQKAYTGKKIITNFREIEVTGVLKTSPTTTIDM